jgi:hypothetical protein
MLSAVSWIYLVKEGTKGDLSVIDNEKVMTINMVTILTVLNQMVELFLIDVNVKSILTTG